MFKYLYFSLRHSHLFMSVTTLTIKSILNVWVQRTPRFQLMFIIAHFLPSVYKTSTSVFILLQFWYLSLIQQVQIEFSIFCHYSEILLGVSQTILNKDKHTCPWKPAFCCCTICVSTKAFHQHFNENSLIFCSNIILGEFSVHPLPLIHSINCKINME